MYYHCLRCDAAKEIRIGPKTGGNATPYKALEKEMKESKIAHLHRTTGQRNLCPQCLEELVAWLRVRPARSANRSRSL
jgi:hypothetical protein